ncbi:MAG: YbbR-like domain-containing protein [Tannerella sp.]|jgi:hypothetical protein|nr:YbbR-like domain-containing protein [Tannerella sp.]
MSRLDNQSIFKSIIGKIRGFFHQQKWKEYMIFLFFVLLSLGLWYLQSLQQEYEIEIEIPVKYKNTPANMILTENNPKTIVAKIKDKGTVMLNYIWMHTFSPVEIDMKSAESGESQVTALSRRAIEANISRQLFSSTSLISFEPQIIQVEYTELKSKELPVRIDIDLSMKPGFQLADSIKVVPEKAFAHAGNTVLDSLFVLKTVHKEIKNLDKLTEVVVRLQPVNGVRMEPNEVKLIIPVEEFTEKRFTLPVLCTDIPDNYVLRTFPASVEIICNIPMSKFKDLSENDFEILIPFREFEENQSAGELLIHLEKKPDWISTPVISPNTIQFIIEQANQ